MKKRSRLRKRIRDWLTRRKERKEENPIPSFSNRSINRNQEKMESPNEFFHNEKPTAE